MNKHITKGNDPQGATCYSPAMERGVRFMHVAKFSAVAFLFAGFLSTASAQYNTFERTFYVPLTETELFGSMQKIHSAIAPPLRGQLNIVPSVTNTILVYDHWEDDFEDDINSPTQATTQVWGDGNLANGVLPGYPLDLVVAGGTIELFNLVTIPHLPTNILYDAGDKIKANLPISVARVIVEQVTGEALSGAVSMYPVENFGLEIVAPIGTNVQTDTVMFQVADMFVSSSADGNIIQVDADGDGIFEDTEILEEGEGLRVEGVNASGRVRASFPIQGYLITGASSANKQMRWIALVPDLFWSDRYLSGVGEVKNEEFAFYIYNDNNTAITTRYETLFATNTLVVPARGVTNYFPPDDTATRFTSLGGEDFQVVGIHDHAGSSYEWGFGVFPIDMLTEMILVGYGPGSGDGSRNGNPIWFTPASNTTVYIDYDGDPATGASADPQGNLYDTSLMVTPLNIYRVYDTNDNDQTGMRIYALDTTELAGSWGQDADSASAGSPYLDMGYGMFPLPALAPTKRASLYSDNDGDGRITPGDEIIYTVSVTRIGFDLGDGDVIVLDEGPSSASYTNGTTVLSGSTNLSDSVVPPGTTLFPLDETGTNIGFLALGQTVVLTYRAIVPNPFPVDQAGIVNCVEANGNRVCLFTPVSQGAQVTGKVLSDYDGDGDPTDPDTGIPGVSVVVFTDPNCDGNSADGSAIATSITASTGGYFFNVETGCYVLVEQDLPDWYSTGDTDGANDNRIALSLAAGESSSQNNFLDALLGFRIDKTSEPGGIWFPFQQVTYRVTLNNTGDLDQAGVWMSDFMGGGLASVTGSAQVSYSVRATNSFRDLFNTVAYNNNDGSDNWQGDWTESLDDGLTTAGAGHIGILSNRLYIQGNNPAPALMNIRRGVELTGLTGAELSFSYGSSIANDGVDVVTLDVSTNLASWTTLAQFAGNVTGNTNINLSPYISGVTYIRFGIAAQMNSADEHFWFDDVSIRATEVSTMTRTASVPQVLLTNYVSIADGSIVVTFTATVGTTHSWVTNTACFASNIRTAQICDTDVRFVDTSALPYRISGRVLNDIDGDASPLDPDEGIPGVTIRVFTDPNGDGDPADGVAVRTNITDASGYYLVGNLTPGDYVVVETNLPGFASINDSDGGNNDRVAVEITGVADIFNINFYDWTVAGLEIRKYSTEQGDVDFGETFSYIVVVTNTRAQSQAGLAVTDLMPEGLDYVSGSSVLTSRIPAVTNTFRDEFNQIAYTNNHGSASFNNAWGETGDDGNPATGDLLISGDGGNNRLTVKDDDNSISRMVNLVTYQTAILSFDFRRDGLDDANEYVNVEVSTNPATGWIRLGGFTNGTDAAYRYTNYNITAHISTSTWIRFISPAGGMGDNDGVKFDNVQIQAMKGGTTISTAGAPASLLSGYTISGGETLIFTFNANVAGGDTFVNQACFTTLSDPAGFCGYVTNSLGEILLTQGVVEVKMEPGALRMSWTAGTNSQGVVSRDYDLIYVDQSNLGWHHSLSDDWIRVSTVWDSTYVDTGAPSRISPPSLGNAYRFYRSARADRWQTSNDTRYASKEIYVAKCLNVKRGENWCSLVAVPDTNSVVRVFGTNQLPAGAFYDEAARIEWYGPTQDAKATNIIWLASPGIWMYATGGVANNMSVPLNEGFNVIIPTNSPATNYALTVIGKLPTNAVAAHGQIQPMVPGGIYNVASYAYPYRVELEDSGLRSSGFKGAPPGQSVNPNNSDEIRIMEKGPGSLGAPKYRILMNSSGQFVYWSGGPSFLGSAEKHSLNADEAIIIYTRASSNSWTWVQPVPYVVPTVFMSP